MNNSLGINANLSSSNVEDCFLPLSHGIALMTVDTLTALLGTFGNILVCIAVLTNPRLRRFSNFLLVSLAIADLIVTMICEPLVVAMVGKRALFHECTPHFELAYSLLANLSCSSSLLHLAAISVDRFIAVVFPLRHGRIMKNYGLKTMLVVVWIVAIIFASVRGPFPTKTYHLAVVMFTVVFALIFACYASILITLLRERKRNNHLRAKPSVVVNSKVELRVAFTLAIVIFMFTASWFPLIIVFYARGKSLVKMYGPAYMWIRSLALSNSATNFIIYSARIRDFRDAYALICRKILRC